MRGLVAVLVLVLAACGNGESDNTREVDRRERGSGAVPTQAIDAAVRTEAMTHMSTLNRQIRAKAAAETNRDEFYKAISGRLDAPTLERIGMTESQLTGRYYRPGDYTIRIEGRTMTIEAAREGTRGRVEPQEFRLP